MGFVYKTSRWQKIGWEYPEAYWREGKPFILCFWHNRLLMACFTWTGPMSIHMLISAHSDGQIIAKTIGHFGLKTIAGSSSKGGAQALRQMIKALKNGDAVGITPDGPRGPRFEVSEGIVSLARLSGLDILPVSFGVSRRRVLSSWDRFILALPFSKGVLLWGEPITPQDWQGEDGACRLGPLIQERLTHLTQLGDTLCGVDIVT
ncbi:MAG: hypothetical protein C0514_07735 [Candidatus Puniceispirillum sp.]|nr:hypothetical protein [Candidatus Puniceispirillum sp.]